MADTDNKLDWLTKIDDVHWNVGGSVKFDANGSVLSPLPAPSLPTTYSQLSCSFWFNRSDLGDINVDVGNGQLFVSFGPIIHTNNSYVGWTNFGGSVQFLVEVGTDLSGATFTADVTGIHNPPASFPGAAFFIGKSNIVPSSQVMGWNHVLVTVDTRNRTTYEYAANDVDTVTASDPTHRVFLNGIEITGTGIHPDHFIYDEDGSTIFEEVDSVTPNAAVFVFNIIDPWDAAAANGVFGVPANGMINLPDGGNVAIAEMRLWFNQIISTPSSLFTTKNGFITPAPAKQIDTAFGPPAVYLHGKKDKFVKSGSLILASTGTGIADYPHSPRRKL